MTRDKEIRILCYGDSNTWGYIPGSSHFRYKKNERWTGILQSSLGSDYTIIEEGLNSRTLISNDERPGKEGRSGAEYLLPCLDTHDPLDIVVLMLGTNELKTAYNKTSKEIGEIIESHFVNVILNRKSQFMNSTPKLILVCPPMVDDTTGYCKNKYEGARAKSAELNVVYKNISEKYGCEFISNDGLSTGSDGVHLSSDGHEKLAKFVEAKIKKTL